MSAAKGTTPSARRRLAAACHGGQSPLGQRERGLRIVHNKLRHGLYHQSTTGAALHNEKKPFTHLFSPAGATTSLGNLSTGRGDGHRRTPSHCHHGNQSFLPPTLTGNF
ncbi:hypothetical protein Q8A67_018814 [Cirrhinus molitorella]|uniref:Uncharacterized protein n=1 Tax=Cirrhinus molitorella TaxID=172907 RepID=A0AA88TF39_9TELE|nr:hypothetical protein Q8A67_018814 [Cirrhinus molitorella]